MKRPVHEPPAVEAGFQRASEGGILPPGWEAKFTGSQGWLPPRFQGARRAPGPGHSLARGQRGVALVITLIMLALIVVLVMAFLAVSTRERSAVADTGSQQDAQMMVQTALERVKAQILFEINARTNLAGVKTNLLGPDLAVSLSYPTFDPDAYAANPNSFYNIDTIATNLNTPLNPDPRAPVFVNTNRGAYVSNEFRYYVDVNRNWKAEGNGLLPVVDSSGTIIGTNFVVGEPEWIGITSRPNEPHSAANRFFGRFAYLIQPVGRALDANYIHNHANLDQPPGQLRWNRYWRNQGVGSWELNQAAFLADLNTNVWNNPLANPYVYFDNGFNPGGNGSTGFAFDDATDFLRFRYGYDLRNLASVEALFGLRGASLFRTDYVDGYVNGPLGPPTGPDAENDDPTWPWCGADSTNHFFSVHDLFDTNKCGVGFVWRLALANAGTSSYDRYTTSRLFGQLATDSAPEPALADPDKLIRFLRARGNDWPLGPMGKINLNYDNLGQSATNLLEWPPEKFFQTTANVLLWSQYNFGVTNIPVFPTNFYTPGVHRLLQIAANLREAMRPAFDPANPDTFPLVFRPIIREVPVGSGSNFVTGYIETNQFDLNTYLTTDNTNGIPLVIGAKKGIPNFNEYTLKTLVQAVRKVELRRPAIGQLPNLTNEMFILSITNFVGLELWNSYTTPFPVPFQVTISSIIRTCLTNEVHPYQAGNPAPWTTTNILSMTLPYPNVNDPVPGTARWYFRGRNYLWGGFAVPISNTVPILASMIYRPITDTFELIGSNNLFTDNQGQFIERQWGLSISNALTYILSVNGRILDFVHLPHIDSYVNITEQLMSEGDGPTDTGFNLGILWRTNKVGNSFTLTAPTEGVMQQIEVSRNPTLLSDEDWKNYNNNYDPVTGSDKDKGGQAFASFLTTNYTNINLAMQTPFNPIRKFVLTTSLQANDPLVHYTVEDLLDRTNYLTPEFLRYLQPAFTNNNLAAVNDRYRPWGGNPKTDPDSDLNASDVSAKDPGMWSSDFWMFPTNKFPNLGWVGRVHRGTPWQTIYLKSKVAEPDNWAGVSLDPATHPTNDWHLLDVFTAALHPNATRGQLSINQGGLAAWSAVLSGVMALTNLPPTDLPQAISNVSSQNSLLLNTTIEPSSPQLLTIVDGINQTQATSGPFRRLGDILRVPELTVASPYLGLGTDSYPLYSLNDLAYERIPQQILSLLKVGEPRFVIYAFGQALKPAPRSIQTDSRYFQLCTNYQVTAELYTRAVARVEGTLADPRVVIESYNILPTD